MLIPLECEYFALRGMALLMDTIDKVREDINPDLAIVGILATMYDSRTVLSARSSAGSRTPSVAWLKTVIAKTIQFAEAPVAEREHPDLCRLVGRGSRVPRAGQGRWWRHEGSRPAYPEPTSCSASTSIEKDRGQGAKQPAEETPRRDQEAAERVPSGRQRRDEGHLLLHRGRADGPRGAAVAAPRARRGRGPRPHRHQALAQVLSELERDGAEAPWSNASR